MKRSTLIIGAALAASLPAGATSALPDARVDSAYNARKATCIPATAAKAVADKHLSPEQREALKFLYAYMSLPDMAAYTPQFYLANIDASLEARRTMPWGNSIPDREWLHFVLPVRINNEDMDLSRPIFYGELRERVKGMSMEEAILEVNHWCHEKVTYRPSDARTSSPLSAVSQAIGRCGEESTFLVAALRAVGIPARQVYTPRWAHTDDNHAWVEAWADGKWHFLGACEPEPVLDLAWFNAPASRGMLMNTNVFGDYDGPEETLWRHPLVTRINITSNYAPTRTVRVRVADKSGKPVSGAEVRFCIYNYAEYFPLAVRTTDSDGCASVLAGKGDMVVWAAEGNRFAVAEADTREDGVVEIVLDKDGCFSGAVEFDITPPPGGTPLPAVSDEQRRENDRRMALEDSIRHAYMDTFADADAAAATARRLGTDVATTTKVLTESRGNHKQLEQCIAAMPAADRSRAVRLLAAVSEKDRRDIDTLALREHVQATADRNCADRDFFDAYVLSPRIERERIVPFRSRLAALFSAKEADAMRRNPQALADYIARLPRPDASLNPMALRMDPVAALEAGCPDDVSRNILFVAAARSLGIPARIDPVTAKTQYALSPDSWTDVVWQPTAADAPAARQGKLNLRFSPSGYDVDPKYYSSFSISRIDGGFPVQLEYPEEATYSSTFASPVALDAGQYVLTTGRRLADGGVLAHSEIFVIKPDATTTLDLKLRADNSALSVIGNLDAESRYFDIAADADRSLLQTAGRGYYVLGIISPNHEPSAHTLNDLAAVRSDFDAIGRHAIVLFRSDDDAAKFRRELFPELPANLHFGIDRDGAIASRIASSLHLTDPEMPLFIVADSFGRIVYATTGYTIGLGDRLNAILRSLRE